MFCMYSIYKNTYPEKKSKEFMACPTFWERTSLENVGSVDKKGMIMNFRKVRRC